VGWAIGVLHPLATRHIRPGDSLNEPNPAAAEGAGEGNGRSFMEWQSTARHGE